VIDGDEGNQSPDAAAALVEGKSSLDANSGCVWIGRQKARESMPLPAR
jgi:hypothetical protein